MSFKIASAQVPSRCTSNQRFCERRLGMLASGECGSDEDETMMIRDLKSSSASATKWVQPSAWSELTRADQVQRCLGISSYHLWHIKAVGPHTSDPPKAPYLIADPPKVSPTSFTNPPHTVVHGDALGCWGSRECVPNRSTTLGFVDNNLRHNRSRITINYVLISPFVVTL